MRTILTITTLTMLTCAASNCGKNDQPTKPTAAATHAAQKPCTDAKPGSYEDWCQGHQVPESLCTRCNPSLIPAFKATGDWCVKHLLPESQCLKCNPKLKIERPPKTTGKGA